MRPGEPAREVAAAMERADDGDGVLAEETVARAMPVGERGSGWMDGGGVEAEAWGASFPAIEF